MVLSGLVKAHYVINISEKINDLIKRKNNAKCFQNVNNINTKPATAAVHIFHLSTHERLLGCSLRQPNLLTLYVQFYTVYIAAAEKF